MGKPAFFAGLAVLAGFSILGSAQSAERQDVSFASLDGTQITAVVFRPDVPDGQIVATVVALHGCGGIYATSGQRKGQPNSRHQALADMMLADGYAVVFPDSFTPRGETSLCTQKYRTRTLGQTQRRADALATMAWVASQPWASPARIAIMGWSHGGSAVLSATDAGRAEVRSQPVKPAVALAFYPGCAEALKFAYKPSAPLVLMLGEKDDWTPPGPCLSLGKSAGAEVHLYADSYHDFDAPTGEVRLRSDVPNGLRPGEGVHAGPNPAAREQAYTRLRQVFRTALAR